MRIPRAYFFLGHPTSDDFSTNRCSAAQVFFNRGQTSWNEDVCYKTGIFVEDLV